VSSDNRLPVLIFVVLVALIAAPFIWNAVRDARRPQLVGARIVTATGADPVHRTGARRVGPREEVSIALALEVERSGGRRWLAPADELEIDGSPVEHTTISRWPEDDRRLRVFWFTVESSNVGGTVDPANAAATLRFRSMLAAEMGHDLVAAAFPEAHNDDHLGPSPGTLPITAGTIRLYARVEVVDPSRSEISAVQSTATRGPEGILEPDFPTIHRALATPEGLHPEVGELFNLSGWETATGTAAEADAAARAAFGVDFHQLVSRRILTSSRTFAAVATTGTPSVGAEPQADPVVVSLADGTATREGRPVPWDELRPGDWLVSGSHVVVLTADDGDGVLNGGDIVLHCWRRPPQMATLAAVVPDRPTELKLVRHGR
jgi:hypothetical protein